MTDSTIRCVSELINPDKSVTILTGAGVSAESGIATFRAPDKGLWAKYKPEDLATPEAFERNPKTVWDWYRWRREQLKPLKPNPGHYALAQLQNHVGQCTLITQNVDRLHQLAGSRSVIELHGTITRYHCHISGIDIDPDWVEKQTQSPIQSPHDPNGFVRPSVIWFGEALPEDQLQQALTASHNCDLFFSIGSSALVEPAASLARIAHAAGACVIEINPETTPLTGYIDHHLQGPSGIILPKIIAELELRT